MRPTFWRVYVIACLVGGVANVLTASMHFHFDDFGSGLSSLCTGLVFAVGWWLGMRLEFNTKPPGE